MGVIDNHRVNAQRLMATSRCMTLVDLLAYGNVDAIIAGCESYNVSVTYTADGDVDLLPTLRAFAIHARTHYFDVMHEKKF